MPIWLSVFFVASLLVLVLEGRPVLYVSARRYFRDKSMRIVKFRTMIKRADQVANRDTIQTDGTRFLNIPSDSPLYTPIGRIIERFCLTELPQVVHVLAGKMCIVGNRPLPQNVVRSLVEVYPGAEERFKIPAGLTGPAQLVGRDALTDEERLELEVLYCNLCANHYTTRMDFMILLYTVLIALHFKPRMTGMEVKARLMKWAGALGQTSANQQADAHSVPRKSHTLLCQSLASYYAGHRQVNERHGRTSPIAAKAMEAETNRGSVV